MNRDAKKENKGAELSDAALDKVAGGEGGADDPCPNCDSIKRPRRTPSGFYICPDCKEPRTVNAGQQGLA